MTKPKNPSRRLSGTVNVLALVLAAAATMSVAYYLITRAPAYFNSDTADTILWAQQSYEAKALFNRNFSYAALLPFGSNLWLVPLVALFGTTMKAQVAGTVIFLLLFTAALVFLCRSLGFNLRYTAFTVFTITTVMSASDKLREIMWEHTIYYSLSLLLIFLVLGLALRLIGVLR